MNVLLYRFYDGMFFSHQTFVLAYFSIHVIFQLFIDIIYGHFKLIKININDNTNFPFDKKKWKFNPRFLYIIFIAKFCMGFQTK